MTVSKEVRDVFKWHLGLWLLTPWRLTKELFEMGQDHWYDKKLGIQTCVKDAQKPDGGVFRDGNIYGALPYHEAFEMLEYLKLGPEEIAVDLGCGKGRVLCLLGLKNLKSIVGVEIQPRWAALAERNVGTFLANSRHVRVAQGDAALYEFSDETFIFMLNPFGWKTFRKVMENLKDSTRKFPRRIRIAYYGPYKDFLDAEDWLVSEGEIGKTEIRVWHHS